MLVNIMDGPNTIITHHAILIGIDAYPDKPLKSCVNDVQDTKMFLEGTLKDFVEIQAFTASQTSHKISNPAQDPMLWPSRENVILAFETVTSLSKAGDYVYIHYSGHGTQKPPSGDFSNTSTGDLALVLLGGGKENRKQYLWGFELASLLKNMVDNDLVITLILDCCFSGSVYRHDEPSVRFLPYDPEFESDRPLDPKKNVEDGMYRDVSMQPNWLLNPDRYAILTACGPHQVAIEPRFEGKNHGALSYFLLDFVKDFGLTKRHRDMHNYLCAKFRDSILPQNPVLYGNGNQGFFGKVSSDINNAAIPIIVRQDGTIELQAGYAHGVNTDDQLLLHPLDCVEHEPRSRWHSVAAEVADARALTSDIKLSDTPSIPIQTGWMAKVLTRSALQKFPIRLSSELPCRDELLKALKDRSLDVSIDSEDHPFAINVVSNERKYEIPNEEGYEIIDLTGIPQDQSGMGQIGSILEHLARFRLARDLVNDASTDPFRKSFEVRIVSNRGVFSPDCLIEMEDDTTADLIIENKGDEDLYISVYDLGPCWQVQNPFRGTNIVVRPQSNGKQNKPIRKKIMMTIPKRMREKGYCSCKDILKIFATSRAISFDSLELPRLGERAKTPAANRTSQDGGSGRENWAALNFSFHTSLQRNTSTQ
ncbi:hypothetical protein ONS95_014765 [Cadophora gregata]|uniref:uncharacterized protein n=1 Tax=Cadophora gregata TaxID=51156 RepID=UPI0026DAAB28|nr:uncharacterized protein ONS95_014765 [Cadophora gregata]KAK0113059.1 hypothetical protein ONS95_014765 [Cadophora gregata]